MVQHISANIITQYKKLKDKHLDLSDFNEFCEFHKIWIEEYSLAIGSINEVDSEIIKYIQFCLYENLKYIKKWVITIIRYW